MLLVVAGASGSGKDSIISAVSRLVPLERVAAYTTRPQRAGEVSGLHYRFVGRGDFEALQLATEFFDVVVVNGFQYGTPLSDFQRASEAACWYVIPMAVHSALSLRDRVSNVQVVYILPPSRDVQVNRLIQRGFAPDQALARMGDDPDDPAKCLECDLIIVNYAGELDEAAQRVARFLQA